jgi:hypothetical protein
MKRKRDDDDNVETLDVDETAAETKQAKKHKGVVGAGPHPHFTHTHVLVLKSFLQEKKCFDSPFLSTLLEGDTDSSKTQLAVPFSGFSKDVWELFFSQNVWLLCFSQKEEELVYPDEVRFLELCAFLGHSPSSPLRSPFVSSRYKELEQKETLYFTGVRMQRALLGELIRKPINQKAAQKARLDLSALPSLDVDDIKAHLEVCARFQFEAPMLHATRILLQSESAVFSDLPLAAQTAWIQRKVEQEARPVAFQRGEVVMLRWPKGWPSSDYCFPVIVHDIILSSQDQTVYFYKALNQAPRQDGSNTVTVLKNTPNRELFPLSAAILGPWITTLKSTDSVLRNWLFSGF